MKKETAIAVAIGILAGSILSNIPWGKLIETPKPTTLEFYEEIVEEMEPIRIIDSDDLTMEMLQNRKGTIIIEKCIGIVNDKEGNGKLLNCSNPEYFYISYKSVPKVDVGDVILTYFVYNPDNNIEDDITERFDFIIDK